MVKGEILIVKTKREGLSFKIREKGFNGWSPSSYENVIACKDSNKLALLLYDLDMMGFPVKKAIDRFKSLREDPKEFFLK